MADNDSYELVRGPGYAWRVYQDQGQDFAALYLSDHLLRRNGRGWQYTDAFDGSRRVHVDDADQRLIDARNNLPDGYTIWPEHAELVIPPSLIGSADAQAVLDAIAAEYGISGIEAWKLADQITGRIAYERASTLARRIVRDDQLAREADLAGIDPVDVETLLARPREPRTQLFGDLMAAGHNATVVARWKTGKSTFVDNAAIAAAAGGRFLGHFAVPEPKRVVVFNYELHDDDMADRMAQYAIPGSARANIVIVNLRGRRLPLTTRQGRDHVTSLLADCGAQLWIIDPFGAAFASAGGEDENSNAEVRRFLIAIDEIKRLAGCDSCLMPVHTGRKVDQEGDEQGRGATVLEDWPDVRMLLTRGQKEQREHRFLRTEGRAWQLDESRLTFDPASHGIGLPHGDLGVSRRKAKARDHAHTVATIINEHPGSNTTQIGDHLTDNGITNKGDHSEAINEARRLGLVHYHTINRAKRHYPGPVHHDHQPCDGLKQP